MYCSLYIVYFFFFKQKTAYEMRISDWSSDVCSSDLSCGCATAAPQRGACGTAFRDEIDCITHPPDRMDTGRISSGVDIFQAYRLEIGRASCRERVCQYV